MKIRLAVASCMTLCVLFASGVGAQDYGDAPLPYPSCYHLDQSQGTRLDVIGFGVSDDGFVVSGRILPVWTGDVGDDGVEFINFSKGSNAQVKVAVICTQNTNDLCVWMDFNNDGDWDDAGERVIWAGFSSSAPNGAFSARVPTPGSSSTSFNTYNVAIPAGAAGTSCKVRARLWDTGFHSSGPMAANGGGSPSAITDYGEVEDSDVPYGTSTGSKPDVSVYDPNTTQLTTNIPSGGTDNRGNLTAGQQATLYYGISCKPAATYALRFPGAQTLTITPVANCTTQALIVPAGGYTAQPGGGYFTVIFWLTPTTTGMPYSASVTMFTNDPITPNYTWTISGFAAAPAPQIELQRPAYTPIPNGATDNVGSVAAGGGQSFTWYIVNGGSAALNLTGSPLVSLSGFSNCSASVTSQPAASLPAGGYSTSFAVQVVPAATGAFSFQMTILSNDSARSPYTVTVAGNGGAAGGTPNMNVQRPVSTTIASGGNDNLGSLNTGAASSFTYTIGNSGTGSLLLNGSPLVALSNPSNCNVTVSSQPSGAIASMGSTSFVVQVTPAAAGAFGFRISIANTDTAAGKNPYVINVSGAATSTSAPEIDVQRPAGSPITSGGTDNLGQVATGAATLLTYTVANLGSASLALSGATPVTISGTSNCSAAVATQPAASVAAASTATFSVSLTPTTAAAFSFVISIANSDSNENPYTITVSGTGIVNGPEIDLQRPVSTSLSSGSTDALGSVAFGVNIMLAYTIANTGNQVLNLTGTPGVTVSGQTNCSATLTSAPGGSVPAGSSASFSITYNVSGLGAFSFQFSIANNDANEGTYVINVSGAGGTLPDITVRLQSANLADGGTANVGNAAVNTPVLLTFSVSNTGNAPLNLTTATPVVTGAVNNCAALVLQQPAALTLAPGASTTFVLEVTASSLTSFGFSVSISSNDPDENPFNFTVQGAGSTFTVGSSSGGSGGGGGCAAQSHDSRWLAILPVALLAALCLRRRRSST